MLFQSCCPHQYLLLERGSTRLKVRNKYTWESFPGPLWTTPNVQSMWSRYVLDTWLEPTYQMLSIYENLNNYFNFHVCLSILSFRPLFEDLLYFLEIFSLISRSVFTLVYNYCNLQIAFSHKKVDHHLEFGPGSTFYSKKDPWRHETFHYS